MATSIEGPRVWSMSRDSEGHRSYKIVHGVVGLITDGPSNVLNTPGLPVIGAVWDFDDDYDPWAFCKPDADVQMRLENEPNRHWTVEQTFTTKPGDDESERCEDASIEDPLLEPDKVSGSFKSDKKEGKIDKNGDFIVNSAFEALRGAANEWDYAKSTVRIEQNVAALGLATFAAMFNTVNVSTLWGLPPRTIKLSGVTWEKKWYGQCNVYYTRTFEFDIDENGHDRDIQDEGTKCLNGHWDPDGGYVLDDIGGDPADPDNPADMIRFRDRSGELGHVILNGAAVPLDGTWDASTPGEIHVEFYTESNFLTLGIPTSF